MQPPNKNPAERGAFGGIEILDLIGVEIKYDRTQTREHLQAFKLASRFGLSFATASAVVELAGIGGGA